MAFALLLVAASSALRATPRQLHPLPHMSLDGPPIVKTTALLSGCIPLAARADVTLAATPAPDGLPPDSLLVAVVAALVVGAGALQLSLGNVLDEVDNLPPSMGSQAKRERMKSGGFLREDDRP